jgi:hypothetical protein
MEAALPATFPTYTGVFLCQSSFFGDETIQSVKSTVHAE